MSIVYISLLILSLFAASQYFYDKIRAKNRVVAMRAENCIGCRRCLGKCPRQVFDIVNDGLKMRIVIKQPNLCTACGNCVAVCKYNALSIVPRK